MWWWFRVSHLMVLKAFSNLEILWSFHSKPFRSSLTTWFLVMYDKCSSSQAWEHNAAKDNAFRNLCQAEWLLVLHRYDDYDYGEVNQLLERSLKVYIKTVTCYPERTTKRMYDSYWRQFKHSEKVCVPKPKGLHRDPSALWKSKYGST